MKIKLKKTNNEYITYEKVTEYKYHDKEKVIDLYSEFGKESIENVKNFEVIDD